MKAYYQDDFVELYHGDCREVSAWTEAHALVTDPPYGIGASSWKDRYRYGPDVHSNAPKIAGEPRINRSSTRVLTVEHVAVRDEALALWDVGKPALVFGSWRAPRPSGVRQRLVWDKGYRGAFGGFGPWAPSDEEIYVLGEWQGDRETGTVLRFDRENDSGRVHPNMKPLPLMRALIGWTSPGAVVADPFAGSGSTLMAAKELGRRAIGVEVDERYCDAAARRLSQEVLYLGEAA